MKYAESTIRKHRKQWLDALESGDYSQCKGKLVKTKQTTGEPVSYCCLGVAATLAKVPSENVKGDAGNKYRHGVLMFWDGGDQGCYEETEMLPEDAMEWLGLRSGDPELDLPPGHKHYNIWGTSLVSLNDRGVSFADIAAMIREYGFTEQHDALKWKKSVTS